tara:strand:+ start:5612 stop:6406 length:795 start_codon:yes stop_codon:yes gene_type:complete
MSTQKTNGSKKRGRKPKGGKIISEFVEEKKPNNVKPNIILHLKCTKNDIDNYKNVSSFQPSESNSNSKLNIYTIENKKEIIDIIPDPDCVNKEITNKLKKLQSKLHNNDISDKKSACFWCTCSFDNPPIYIPKFEFKNTYHVYGCFCSPECATSFLLNENIDESVKFERYHLLNFIYSKIYGYTKNIKPAPCPFYTLDKYFGNLSIGEYRKLLNNDKLLLIVEKPLTRILPELIETNDDVMQKPHSMIKSNEIKQKNFSGHIFS